MSRVKQSRKAGDYRHLVYIQQPDDSLLTPDRGDTLQTFIDVGEEWCSIEPLMGRELLFARQVRADVTHKVEMMFRPDITHRSRLKWIAANLQPRYYNPGPIVNHDLRDNKLWFFATEIL